MYDLFSITLIIQYNADYSVLHWSLSITLTTQHNTDPSAEHFSEIYLQ